MCIRDRSGSFNKWMSDHFVTYIKNGFKLDKTSIDDVFANHLNVVAKVNRERGVVGGHNINAFKDPSNLYPMGRVHIVSETPSNVNGVSVIEYRLHALDAQGNISPNLLSKTYNPKTVFDPNVWSPAQMKELGYKGFMKAIDNGTFNPSGRTFNGSVDGVTVRGHYLEGAERIIATWWLE